MAIEAVLPEDCPSFRAGAVIGCENPARFGHQGNEQPSGACYGSS
jgi:hypothetical protein